MSHSHQCHEDGDVLAVERPPRQPTGSHKPWPEERCRQRSTRSRGSRHGRRRRGDEARSPQGRAPLSSGAEAMSGVSPYIVKSAMGVGEGRRHVHLAADNLDIGPGFAGAGRFHCFIKLAKRGHARGASRHNRAPSAIRRRSAACRSQR